MGAMEKSDIEVLENVVQGGTMEYSLWPGLLERLLPRLDSIVRNDFKPLQSSPAVVLAPTTNQPPQPSSESADPATSSQDTVSQTSRTTNKENAPPSSPPPARPPVPPFSSTAVPAAKDAALSASSPANSDLPPHLLSILSSIHTTLTTNFAVSPPHTIQRLAELILRPRVHYRSVASYLRALDRVVSVSSGADIFPLPTASISDASGEASTVLLNGTSGALGSDESLGGALLTPIPWLRNEQHGEVRIESTETVDGPNGVGSIETVTVSVRGIPSTITTTTLPSSPGAVPQVQEPTMRDAGAVTQGELLRQEQEAGVVPVLQTHVGRQTRSATARGMNEEAALSASASKEADEEEQEHPHARGPEEVGMEDMGPQERSGAKAGFDVEAALGRSVKHKGADKQRVDDDEDETEMKDADEDQDATQEEPDTLATSAVANADKDDDDEATEMVDADGQAERSRR